MIEKWSLLFEEAAGGTWIVSNFEAESQNPVEMQEMGWNNILQNFKNMWKVASDPLWFLK